MIVQLFKRVLSKRGNGSVCPFGKGSRAKLCTILSGFAHGPHFPLDGLPSMSAPRAHDSARHPHLRNGVTLNHGVRPHSLPLWITTRTTQSIFFGGMPGISIRFGRAAVVSGRSTKSCRTLLSGGARPPARRWASFRHCVHCFTTARDSSLANSGDSATSGNSADVSFLTGPDFIAAAAGPHRALRASITQERRGSGANSTTSSTTTVPERAQLRPFPPAQGCRTDVVSAARANQGTCSKLASGSLSMSRLPGALW
jgi:hypothetical protein